MSQSHLASYKEDANTFVFVLLHSKTLLSPRTLSVCGRGLCVCVCICECMYVCKCVCVYMWVCMYVSVHASVHIYYECVCECVHDLLKHYRATSVPQRDSPHLAGMANLCIWTSSLKKKREKHSAVCRHDLYVKYCTYLMQNNFPNWG